ncbi:MAG: aspartate-semialdehyde dehydrogenase [Candidatus Amoebophilus sp.]
MKLAIIGATGLVGSTLLKLIEERQFPIQELLLVASENSEGQTIFFKDRNYKLITLDAALAARPTVAIFSVGAEISLTWAPRFAEIGTTVIDNSTAWRMHPNYKLIIPEVNAHLLTPSDKIIANPNCSTIQLVMALASLHRLYQLKRLVISTYQAVTGSGKATMEQLLSERKGTPQTPSAYPHPIDLNLIPQIDDFLENGYTKEEIKLVNETRKILNDESIQVTATAVRVPVLGGHSMSVNAAFEQDFSIKEVIQTLKQSPGLVVQDNIQESQYPMPIIAQNRNEVFVGRIRRDESQRATLNLWIVADNLRKGAATNAIQIAEYLQAQHYLSN